MGVVHEHESTDGGSSAAVLAIFLIALVVILAILFYGFTAGHWFGGTVNVNVSSPPNPGGSVAPSFSPSLSPGR